ncbi:MAG: carboxypeptidase-like regulatory domain-containing protein [Candidatus Hydrogenedentes bacterium]|nr:carboxypeptidase-like regulatory domain-containing protein [Candidatus Hydrogenedentota bacterium]
MISEIPEALGYPMVRETDETGCVVFDQVPVEVAELGNIAVMATAPNGVKGLLIEIPDLRVGATAESVITLAEEYAGEVSGMVADAQGNPLQGIPVIVAMSNEAAQCVRTDANGLYSAGVPMGTSMVLVASDLLGPGQVKVEPPAGQFEVNAAGTVCTQSFTLTWPGEDITFVRSDGAPAGEVWLSASPVLPDRHPGNARWKVATADGQIRTLCEWLYRGIACDAENKSLGIFAVAEDQTEITVTLDEPAGAIAGRIVDPNGQPLVGASVNSSRNAEVYQYVFTWSDAEGRFRIEPLPLNTAYSLSLSLQGYQLLPGSVVTGLQPAPQPVEREYVMAPTDAGVFGQVLAADGSPMPRAYVSLLDGNRRVKSGWRSWTRASKKLPKMKPMRKKLAGFVVFAGSTP